MEIIEDFLCFPMIEAATQDSIPTMMIQCVVNDEVILSVLLQPSSLLTREVGRVPHGL